MENMGNTESAEILDAIDLKDELNIQNDNNKTEFKRKNTIALKLSIFTAISLFVLVVAVVLLANAVISKVSKKDEISSITNIAQGKAQEIGEWLGGTNNMLKAYAETDEIKSDNWDIIRPLLIKAYNRINDSRYLFLAYVQQDGKGWTSKDKWLDATPLPYYAPIIKNNEDFFITNPFTGATTNEPLIIIGHGVRQDGSTKNTSIMIAGIEGKSISSIAENISIGGVGYGVIVDNNGVFVAYPDVEKVMKLNIRDMDNQGYSGMSEIGNDMIAGKENVRMFTDDKGKQNYMVYTPIPNSPDWTLGIIVPGSYFGRLTNNIMAVVAPLAFLFCILIISVSFLFVRDISKPLNATAGALKGIAAGDGDISVRLKVTHSDEPAEISYYFNKTMEKITSTLKAAASSSRTVNVLTDTLVTNVEEEEKTINNIKGLIDGLHSEIDSQNTGIAGTAQSVENIADTISSLDEAIESQKNNITSSSSAIEQMIANIDSVTQILEKNQNLINELEKKSNDVKNSILGSVDLTKSISEESNSLLEASSVIQNIASQTNLLAMNAAIEAAHAGESGKGFAVVADEIRKLAEESSQQSKNITSVLKAFKAKIEGMADSATQTGTDFMQSFELTTKVKQQEEEIMSAMKEQSSGGTQIIKAVSDIAESSGRVKDNSSSMLDASKQILEQMHTLTEISNSIAGNIQNISDGINGFEESVTTVGAMASDTKDEIIDLNMEIGKFKL